MDGGELMATNKDKLGQKIACIGWGSLIWDPRDLPIKGDWTPDGPALPVEFARQSGDDHITLVIIESDHRVPTLWTEMSVHSLAQAVEALKVREGVPYESSIGRWPNKTEEAYPFSEAIEEWATSNGLQGVVWTALPPGMKVKRGSIPTLDELTEHIGKLEGPALTKAQTYIANAPSQIATPYRQELAQACENTLRKMP